MENKFQQFQLSKEIISTLELLKYKEPTEIQTKVIPYAMEHRDILAKSKTGSGKTAAFGIPVCEQLNWEFNEPQALILEPTRELTVQVKEELYLIGMKKRLKVADLFGGFPIDKQIQTLKQKNHIIVGTPGRVLDHMTRGSLKLERINTVVLDEADLMLDMGFAEDVNKILKQIKNKHNTMLFSATLKEEIRQIASDFMTDEVLITIEDPLGETEQRDIVQKLYLCDEEDKYKKFLQIMKRENPENAMIFCGTKEMVNVLCRKLQREKIRCGMIHGDIDQADRLRTIDTFREGQIRFLIATDIIARGIDFDHLSHVINYDFPTGKETYIHRIGRTGRNGAKGTAVSMITPSEERMLKQVEELLGYRIEIETNIDLTEEEERAFYKKQKEKLPQKPRKSAGFAKEAMRISIGGGKKGKIRTTDIVGTISNITGIEQNDIGSVDVRESLSYVVILNGKGNLVLEALQEKPLKGKIRKVRRA